MKRKNNILFVLLCCLLAACKENAPVEEAKAKIEADTITLPLGETKSGAVSVETAQINNRAVMHFTGRVVWNDDVTVRIFPPFAGRVTQIVANPGQAVSVGTPLASIASADYGQAQADAHKAATDYVLAERTYQRIKDLFEHGAAAKKDVEAAEADVERTSSEKIRTTARLAVYGGNMKEIDQVYQLKSPLDGIVVDKNINQGQEVRPDQMMASAVQFSAPLFVITDPKQLWVYLDVNEEYLPHLREGQSLIVRCRAYPEQVFEGKLDVVTDVIDPSTRTVKVRGSVSNPSRLLKSEMYVSVELTQAAKPIVQIPSKAVFLLGTKHYVFLEDGPGRYTRKEVQVGPEIEGKCGVLEGLKEGEHVVTEGALLLQQLKDSDQKG